MFKFCINEGCHVGISIYKKNLSSCFQRISGSLIITAFSLHHLVLCIIVNIRGIAILMCGLWKKMLLNKLDCEQEQRCPLAEASGIWNDYLLVTQQHVRHPPAARLSKTASFLTNINILNSHRPLPFRQIFSISNYQGQLAFPQIFSIPNSERQLLFRQTFSIPNSQRQLPS